MTKKSKLNYILLCLGIIVFSVVLDQVSKIVMEKLLADGNVINVLGSWMTFNWAINHGSSFGGMQGQSLLFFIVTVVGTPAFFYFLWRARTRSWWGKLGFAFMIGGTIGNAIDRAFLGEGFFNGGVRDFISVKGFAVFNVADSFLVVGVIMVCIAFIVADPDAIFTNNKQAVEKVEVENNDE